MVERREKEEEGAHPLEHLMAKSVLLILLRIGETLF